MSFDEVNFDDDNNNIIQEKKDVESYITIKKDSLNIYEKTNHFQEWVENMNLPNNQELKINYISISNFGVGKTTNCINIIEKFKKLHKLSDPDNEKIIKSFDDLEKEYNQLNYKKDETWKKICDELNWDLS